MFSKQFNTTIHVSINRRMNKHGLVYSYNRMIFINKKQKNYTNTCTTKDDSQKHYAE